MDRVFECDEAERLSSKEALAVQESTIVEGTAALALARFN